MATDFRVHLLSKQDAATYWSRTWCGARGQMYVTDNDARADCAACKERHAVAARNASHATH